MPSMTGRPMTEPLAPFVAPGRRPSRLGWSLAAWLALSIGTCLTVLLLHRPTEPAAHDSGLSTAHRAPATSTSASAPGPQLVTQDGSAEWQLRLFYTATEAYYHGTPVPVTGCADLACRPGPGARGRYPRDFVTAVRAQGSGLISSGPNRGRYLEWDADRGYWLDTAPRGPAGAPLVPFVSVISSTPQLSAHTPLRVLSCGAGSRAGWAAVCARLRVESWSVATVAVPAAGRTVRLYVGSENQAGFAAGAWADTFRHAVLRVG